MGKREGNQDEAGMARATVPGPGRTPPLRSREPLATPDGRPLTASKGRRSYVTSAGAGPSVGRHLLMAYLPPEQAAEGTKLAVEYFGDRFPVTVAVAGATPLFAPTNSR